MEWNKADEETGNRLALKRTRDCLEQTTIILATGRLREYLPPRRRRIFKKRRRCEVQVRTWKAVTSFIALLGAKSGEMPLHYISA